MAQAPAIPAGLLSFIKQGAQAPINPMSLIPQLPRQQQDPTLQMRMQQAYKQKMAQEAADKIGGIMGNQAQPEQIGQFDEQLGGYNYTPQQQASGMFEGANPQQAQQLEFAQGLIESGSPALQKQGFGMLDDFNTSALKPTTLMQNYQNYLGMLGEGEEPVPFNEFRRTGTTINIGDGGQSRWMTDEEKESQGIARERAIWIDGKGKPSVVNKEKYTPAQLKKGGFAERMQKAGTDVDAAMKGLDFDPTSARFAAAKSSGPLGNKIMSENGQLYQQAANNWISANLRDESGAVLGEDEIKSEYIKWFPVYGDGPKVIAQKKKRRKEQEQIMKDASGGAFSTKNIGGLPEGTQDLGNGFFKLPTGETVRKK